MFAQTGDFFIKPDYLDKQCFFATILLSNQSKGGPK